MLKGHVNMTWPFSFSDFQNGWLVVESLLGNKIGFHPFQTNFEKLPDPPKTVFFQKPVHNFDKKAWQIDQG
jgi:hypothetical protein